MFGVIDCHCHILPGLDDGAQTIEDSVFLCRWLAGHGVKRAVCTSHSSFLYRNTPETVREACETLRKELCKHGINLELVPSMEYRLIPEVWPEQRSLGLLPWEGNHILIELPVRQREPMGDINPVVEIKRLVSDGYQPVLAHPERYAWLAFNEYESMLDAGAVFQRNLGSLEGFYGDEAARRAKELQRRGCYSFLGTDLHSKLYAEFFDKIL